MSTRALLAARLEHWSQPGGALDFQGPNSSHHLFAADSRREVVLEQVRDQFLSLQSDIDHDGRCAVVTAGPPGAGKSTLVHGLGYGYRRIDPDAIKDLLLKRALDDGTYDPLLTVRIHGDERLQPRELSGLFHTESTVIANDVLGLSVQRQENVVMEGTLSWQPLIGRLIDLFERHEYRDLTILSCDLPEVIAQERALDRWWRDRQDFADELGGRFVPQRVIAALYPKTVDSSQCRENAEEMFMRSRGSFRQVVLQTTDLTGTDTQQHTSF